MTPDDATDTTVLNPPPAAISVLEATSHVTIHGDELQVFVAGQRVAFTVREFQIFNALAERPNRVVRRAEIYGEVWGAAWVHRDRSVDVFVRKIRGKLAAISPEWTYVHTHFGIGYRYHPEQRRPDAPDEPRRLSS